MDKEECDKLPHLCNSCIHQINIEATKGFSEPAGEILKHALRRCLLGEIPWYFGKIYKCDKYENKSNT